LSRVGTVPDPRQRFASCADEYQRHRPGYPSALLDWVLAETATGPGAPVADVGCGTGISTRMLAARGLDVIGIDPSEAMLDRARRGGGARYLCGEAAATGLPAGSQQLVTAAQAFHWFEPAALDELGRVLVAGGWCAAWSNERPRNGAFSAGYERLLREYSSDYAHVPRPADAVRALRLDARVADLRESVFDNRQRLGFEAILGRARSSSYVVHGMSQPEAFAAHLRRLFDAHQTRGELEIGYRCSGYCWRLP